MNAPFLPNSRAAGTVTLLAFFFTLWGVCWTTAGEAAELPWRIIVANDTCPDVTWGFTEAQVRQSFADLIRAHLDEMNRTDAAPATARNHYNVMAFVEVEAFLEKYPDRKDEFLRRVRERRICVSPFLCNTLWGFQSSEALVRAFYPARRMERREGIPIDVAGHTELPSLSWGLATLLAGCGIRWTSVPFLDYDSTFKGLDCPPLFRLAGPDGSEVRVLLDTWASLKAYYRQGGYLLEDSRRVASEWVPHYEQLGRAFPLRMIFASGTHSDINPDSWKQARGFAEAIERFNAIATNGVQLASGTLAQFCQVVDEANVKSSFLPQLRGSFGHSWELWPVSLAATVAGYRQCERSFLAAEALVAIASRSQPGLGIVTRTARERAEWCWAMLADHAWNGTDLVNKRHNAALRNGWVREVDQVSGDLAAQSWEALGLSLAPRTLTVFNPLSFARDVLVECEAPAGLVHIHCGTGFVPSDCFEADGRERLVFVARQVPAYGFRECQIELGAGPRVESAFSGNAFELEGPLYRVKLDSKNGGLSSVISRRSGEELIVPGSRRTLCQTVLWDGIEHELENAESRVRIGVIRSQLEVRGQCGPIAVTNIITLYADLDRIDFDVHLQKPATTNLQRVVHFFPLGQGATDLRMETTGAVLRPRFTPDGDLLSGADARRFAIQGFVDYSPAARTGATLAPIDSYMLRLDEAAIGFEALGNDQNWKEVTQDQNGVTQFRFRYSLRAHPRGYDNAATFSWARSVASPSMVVAGRLPKTMLDRPWLEVDPRRAVATCFKPDDTARPGYAMVRLWETGGQPDNVSLAAPGFAGALRTDLLEREAGAVMWQDGRCSLPVRPFGFAGVTLLPSL